MISCLTRKIVSEEQSASRMLNAPGHFHHILHNLLNRSIWDAHVHCADGDHEVEAWDDIASVLYELIQVCEVVLAGLVGVIKIV